MTHAEMVDRIDTGEMDHLLNELGDRVTKRKRVVNALRTLENALPGMSDADRKYVKRIMDEGVVVERVPSGKKVV